MNMNNITASAPPVIDAIIIRLRIIRTSINATMHNTIKPIFISMFKSSI